MKKKSDSNILNESCIIMNISSSKAEEKCDNEINRCSRNLKLPLKKGINISLPASPSIVATSSDDEGKSFAYDGNPLTEDGKIINNSKSPPLSSLGPGAEIKGKVCHPIPCSSKLEELVDTAEDKNSTSISGGRLTFFKEGKPLLELSHRNDQGSSWFQVKSKTYWPPTSSFATTTSIQHPLRHDIPINTHSDDGSSLVSSPCTSEHPRKQNTPSHCNKHSDFSEIIFYLHRSPLILNLRKCIKSQVRDPFKEIILLEDSKNESIASSSAICKGKSTLNSGDKRSRLESAVNRLCSKIDLKLRNSVANIYTLFEKIEQRHQSSPPSLSVVPCENSGGDPSFITPRKRYLRTLEGDIDTHSKKKIHSSGLNSSLPTKPSQIKNCDKFTSFSSYPLSPSPVPPYTPFGKSTIGSPRSSPYSIDSLLSTSDSDNKKNESFLRTLLNPDKQAHIQRPLSQYSGKQYFSSSSGDLASDNQLGHLSRKDQEKSTGGSFYSSMKERREMNGDVKNEPPSPKRSDLSSQDLSSYGSHPGLSAALSYLNPYFDPRYMMLPPMATPPPSLFPTGASQASGSGDIAASAMAIAAVAAAGYPVNPLQIPSLAGNNGLYPLAYPTPTSTINNLHQTHLRSPTPNRASPHVSLPHSPSPKVLSPAPSHPPVLPRSPHLGVPSSPRDMWTSSSLQGSPMKIQSPSLVTSHPPQDAPLNLSKPKRK